MISRAIHSDRTFLQSLFLLLFFFGCSSTRVPERKEGHAFWVDPRVAVPTGEELVRLEEAGIGEVFLEAGRLNLGPRNAELEAFPIPRFPRRLPAMLVLTADWPSERVDAKVLGEAIANRLQQVRLAVETSVGVLAQGWHLEIHAATHRLQELGEVLHYLRRELDPDLRLSLGVRREWLSAEMLDRAVKAADFLVAIVYGQRPGEPESAAAWDLQEVERNAAKVAALGRPFLLGAAVTGTAYRLSARGDRVAETQELDLKSLVTDPRFALKPGFSLEGVDRQVYEFSVRQGATIGAWTLSPGESVRVVKTATPLVEEWLRQLGVWNLSGQLGVLFFRYPGANERLALGAPQWLAALDPETASPKPQVEVELLEASARVWKVRVRLRNLSDEPSDLSLIDYNYVRLRLDGALVGDVDPGGFYRYSIAFGGTEFGTGRAMRQPDLLVLYQPLLEARASYETGPIELRLKRAVPRILTSGEFLAADGRTVLAPVLEWHLKGGQ